MPEREYEGLPVRKHSLALRGASGDALSSVLKVRPHDFTPGVPVYVLVEAMPGPVRHDPMDEGDAWEHVQIVKVARGTIIDEATAKPYLDEVTVALEDLRIAETGQERLDLQSADARGMMEEHARGLHKRKRVKCPACQGSDEALAHVDELAAKRAEHGDGEGDAENPTPPARTRRSRAKGAKKAPTRK